MTAHLLAIHRPLPQPVPFGRPRRPNLPLSLPAGSHSRPSPKPWPRQQQLPRLPPRVLSPAGSLAPPPLSSPRRRQRHPRALTDFSARHLPPAPRPDRAHHQPKPLHPPCRRRPRPGGSRRQRSLNLVSHCRGRPTTPSRRPPRRRMAPIRRLPLRRLAPCLHRWLAGKPASPCRRRCPPVAPIVPPPPSRPNLPWFPLQRLPQPHRPPPRRGHSKLRR